MVPILRNAEETGEYDKGNATHLLSKLVSLPAAIEAIGCVKGFKKMVTNVLKKSSASHHQAAAAFILGKLADGRDEVQNSIAEETDALQLLISRIESNAGMGGDDQR